MGLGNYRIEGAAEQRRVHLVSNLFESPLEDRERYRINHLFSQESLKS